jgi:acyl-CoA synthetase (AMP-forming)/AMP-acid ligase II
VFTQLGYRPGDILYTCLKLFHANALFLTTMQGLFSGYPAALGRRFSAGRFWGEVRRYGGPIACINGLFEIYSAEIDELWQGRDPISMGP